MRNEGVCAVSVLLEEGGGGGWGDRGGGQRAEELGEKG